MEKSYVDNKRRQEPNRDGKRRGRDEKLNGKKGD